MDFAAPAVEVLLLVRREHYKDHAGHLGIGFDVAATIWNQHGRAGRGIGDFLLLLFIEDEELALRRHRAGRLVGVCSGGAGEFAEEAKRLGCAEYVTGEASWGDVIAAQNVGIEMTCLGHYETEVYGVRAVAKAMRRALKLEVEDLTEVLK